MAAVVKPTVASFRLRGRLLNKLMRVAEGLRWAAVRVSAGPANAVAMAVEVTRSSRRATAGLVRFAARRLVPLDWFASGVHNAILRYPARTGAAALLAIIGAWGMVAIWDDGRPDAKAPALPSKTEVAARNAQISTFSPDGPRRSR